MSNTPRTDAAALGRARLLIEKGKPEWTELVDSNFARQLETELAEARQQLETERMRLAACSTAALGHFTDCLPEYRSAALEDVLQLRQQLVEQDALVERMRESLIECLDDSNQVLAEYEQLYSATYRPQRLEAQKAVVSEAQAALSLTPSAALAEHDVEVRRKVLEEAAQDKGST